LNIQENRHPLAPVDGLKMLRKEKRKDIRSVTRSEKPYKNFSDSDSNLSGGEKRLLEKYRRLDERNK